MGNVIEKKRDYCVFCEEVDYHSTEDHRCGICYELGHNFKKCPSIKSILTSVEERSNRLKSNKNI